MAHDISKAWKTQYIDKVYIEYQRDGSKLRSTVQAEPLSDSNKADFFVMGTVDTVEVGDDKTAPVQVTGTQSRVVQIAPREFQWGDSVGIIDEKKTSRNYRDNLVNLGKKAAGRRVDSLIIEAANLATRATTGAGDLVDTVGLNKAKCQRAIELLDGEEVPEEERYALVDARGWNDLLNIEEFSKEDFIGGENLPYNGAKAKSWMGVKWMMFNGITGGGTGAGLRTGLLYQKMAIGHIDLPPFDEDKFWIDWEGGGRRQSHFIHGLLSTNAKILMDLGVVKIPYTK